MKERDALMKLNTVWKWWDIRRVWLSAKLEASGVHVRPVAYDELSEEEQGIVYDFWLNNQWKTRSNNHRN
jgi:hypothetical protein